MRWRCLRLTYELRSPLHIGYHKIGNVQRTRYYIPARTLWGAVTARLVRSGFSTPDAPEGNYRKIGDLLKRSCAFSYFFLCDKNDTLLYPRYGEKGLYYGGLTQAELERRYLDAHVTTALDAATGSAETGSLHEVEYIAAHQLGGKNQGVRTRVRGWVFLNEEAMSYLGPDKWEEWLGDLQVGGERRYGFGRLVVAPTGLEESLDGWPPGYELQLEGERPRFVIAPDTALLAHTLARSLKSKGGIEPLVGRETTDDGFGRNLTPARICWVPGSVLDEEAVLSIAPDGYWKKDEGVSASLG